MSYEELPRLLAAKEYSKAADLGLGVYPALGGYLFSGVALQAMEVMAELQKRGHPVPEQQLFALVKATGLQEHKAFSQKAFGVLLNAGSDSIRPLLAGIRNGNHILIAACTTVLSGLADRFDVSAAFSALEQAFINLGDAFHLHNRIGLEKSFIQFPNINANVLDSMLSIGGFMAVVQPRSLKFKVAFSLISMCSPLYEDITGVNRARVLAIGHALGKQLSEHFVQILTPNIGTVPRPDPLNEYCDSWMSHAELGVLALLRNESVPLPPVLCQMLRDRMLHLSRFDGAEQELLFAALKRGGIQDPELYFRFARGFLEFDIDLLSTFPTRFRELAEWYVNSHPVNEREQARQSIADRYATASEAIARGELRMPEHKDAMKRFMAPRQGGKPGLYDRIGRPPQRAVT